MSSNVFKFIRIDLKIKCDNDHNGNSKGRIIFHGVLRDIDDLPTYLCSLPNCSLSQGSIFGAVLQKSLDPFIGCPKDQG